MRVIHILINEKLNEKKIWGSMVVVVLLPHKKGCMYDSQLRREELASSPCVWCVLSWFSNFNSNFQLPQSQNMCVSSIAISKLSVGVGVNDYLSVCGTEMNCLLVQPRCDPPLLTAKEREAETELETELWQMDG